MGSGLSAQGLSTEGDWAEPTGSSDPAVAAEYRTIVRLLRAGSGLDRLELRRRLLRMGPSVLPLLRSELGSGNHLLSCQAALVIAGLRADTAAPALRAVVEGRLRGDPLSAAFALGILGDPSSAPSLEFLRKEGKEARSRAAALVALGALGPEAIVPAVVESASVPSGAASPALLVAVALAGGDRHAETARRSATAADDRLRRAAVLALAAGGGVEALPIFLDRCGDEDPTVRRHAIAGLVAHGDAAAVSSFFAKGIHRDPDPRVRARAVSWLVARGAVSIDAASVDPHEFVRAAALVGLLRASESPSPVPARAFVDRDERVRLAACVVGSIVGGPLPKSVFPMFDDADADVRTVALLATAWRRGRAALPDFERLKVEKRDDASTALAEEILGVGAFGEAVLRRFVAARMQVILDDLGLAPSWWVPAALNEAVVEAVALENALPEIVAGNVPQGGDRPRSGPRKVAPELEDVRRHLDRYPLPVRRLATEVPLP